MWIAKSVLEGQRLEERLGPADDIAAADGALSFRAAVAAALAWGRRQTAVIEASANTGSAAAIPTVRAAVEAYSKRRDRAAGHATSSTSHLLGLLPTDCPLGRAKLSHLTAGLIDDWLGRLKRTRVRAGDLAGVPLALSTGSLNRLLNDLRAALNDAIEKHRRQLPGHIAAEVKAGTKTRTGSHNAREKPEGLRMQLLTDPQILDLVVAAFEVDEDFGFVVLIAAATGARFSQLAKLTVADVQVHRARIMMPGSNKGRKRRPRAPAAVPVSADVITRLQKILVGRKPLEPLLQHWVMKRAGGPGKWIRERRRPWGAAAETRGLWAKTIAAAGVPTDTIMYAFRHSSIVRGLVAGLPVRLVAALHDTSIRMIEEHYSAYIVDMTEDLARRHALALPAPGCRQAAE
ncbi:tyrosine-type recombinase/integrase [Rhodopseudomonas palustris]|uniref:tyrosine-type recombinase/integrase n=1 Tax=Rhodopseudomonas palustris TaxID=1076 RepID=UPI0022EFFDF2|nr:tyrosine-type recombinase/integrase [Rhodopseudomonas palustris]WBU31453.1 tyrosine-type recombinase/integrase [Rhodopseudomonas palustris]